ncbi:peptidase inhibitor family I36 protein [Streptomyces europaeiscabiei]|uniref:peptidase inhibitor family I36 protein n=1 Tax=Streptomyces europaeiscabiei TaxID=146819 RepID=UPI000765C37A|nr:peptidase inhibitor family I36 protein [Streptomyces europaeiscabiei]MDX2531427.1 peptidase inhibitor family I36 protein [Streptomyces europaeiscabiei]MDX3666180.1 peptidase inhibitor family I36 protein [Streptomyces europaeiscabiei]MDX3716063.1 peptidase inhibitor family I36 protein [Streptomyces europaeiscabiei]MDX3784035.1 peptidase inhibitor family I36 protein [Streptomyces europaeiscabiei]MDX3837727.1 peptidase inhibitor family I36 protein [Streptomyces europaeiscabiei]
MKKISSVLIAVACAATGVLAAGPASAAEAKAGSVTGGAVATLGQKKINLKRDGWGAAQSCVVYSKTSVRCFKTHAEADKALGYNRAADPLLRSAGVNARALPACADNWTCLYEHINGGGRRLIFSDYYWHNLNEYDFSDKTSSWRNRQSDSWAWLARDEGGRGGQISISTDAYSSNLGAYNDWASSVCA